MENRPKTPDELAMDMEHYARQILALCIPLEDACCRGENVKCPFFYVSCHKLMNILQEFLQDLNKRRQESETYVK